MSGEAQARFECATGHALKISAAADALSTAIYEAKRDGYRASIAIENAVPVGDLAFVGDGVSALHVRATVAFDVGRKVAL